MAAYPELIARLRRDAEEHAGMRNILADFLEDLSGHAVPPPQRVFCDFSAYACWFSRDSREFRVAYDAGEGWQYLDASDRPCQYEKGTPDECFAALKRFLGN